MAEEKKPIVHAGHGGMALTEALEGITFPATRTDILDLLKQKGIEEVQWGPDRQLNLRTVFLRTAPETFITIGDVVNVVSQMDEALNSRGQ
jgi:hypothetical protein